MSHARKGRGGLRGLPDLLYGRRSLGEGCLGPSRTRPPLERDSLILRLFCPSASFAGGCDQTPPDIPPGPWGWSNQLGIGPLARRPSANVQVARASLFYRSLAAHFTRSLPVLLCQSHEQGRRAEPEHLHPAPPAEVCPALAELRPTSSLLPLLWQIQSRSVHSACRRVGSPLPIIANPTGFVHNHGYRSPTPVRPPDHHLSCGVRLASRETLILPGTCARK